MYTIQIMFKSISGWNDFKRFDTLLDALNYTPTGDSWRIINPKGQAVASGK